MIAIYKRISLSDGDLGKDGKDKSNSIENQGELIKNYIEAREELHGISILEFVDDGYTGTNFNRPGFQRMMEEVKFGQVDTIIVKDLSRFGRDYIGVGEYLEQLFPLLGVRFIAINNSYDSNRYIGTTMGLDLAVSNLVNTMYSRDTGKKRKSANVVKWKQGICTGSAAPFGYIFDPDRKGRFKIDPDASKIVRSIFDMALNGLNTKEIAFALNDTAIPVPSVYNNQKQVAGKTNQYTVASKLIWNSSRVWRILTAYEYTGAMVQGKSSVMLTGSKIVRRNPKDMWYITENTHEPIVTHEEYEKAQLVIRKSNRSPIINSPDFVLRKKIRCGYCHRVMVHDFNQIHPTVCCREGIEMKMQTDCPSELYRIDKIETMVFRSLKVMLASLDQLRDKINQKEKEQENLLQIGKQKKKDFEQEIKMLRAEKIHIYEAYAEQTLSLKSYQRKKQELDEKIINLNQKIEKAEKSTWFPEIVSAPVKRLADEAGNYLSATKLTSELVKAFIDNVFVYDKEHIEVQFRFENAILEALQKMSIDIEETMGRKN